MDEHSGNSSDETRNLMSQLDGPLRVYRSGRVPPFLGDEPSSYLSRVLGIVESQPKPVAWVIRMISAGPLRLDAPGLGTPGPGGPRVASAPWTITRHDHEVRVHVIDAAFLGPVETQAIVDAVERHIAEDEVTTVRLDGPELDVTPIPEVVATLAARLAACVEGQGMRLHVGPV